MIQLQLVQAFEKHNGVLTTAIAKEHGVNDSTLRKAVEREDIQKFANGIYYLDDTAFDDLYFMQLKYPKGVYSYETAVLIHWLSTNFPFMFHLTFPRGYHLTNAKEQHIEAHYRAKHELDEEYIDVVNSWDGNPLRVTNVEKTLIDMLRYKQATPGIIDEMVKDYLNREDKNLPRLEEYSKRFKVEDLIEERILSFA